MADTDLPNGYGALNRPPRPIASPFGIFAYPAPPDPNQTPGFNVQPDVASTNPMASLLASFMPSGQDLKQSIAENLGFPGGRIAGIASRSGDANAHRNGNVGLLLFGDEISSVDRRLLGHL